MLASDIETALKAPPYNFGITTVRSQGGVFSAEAVNPNDQAAIDAALPTVISNLETAAAADALTISDLKANYTGILDKIALGITAANSAKTAVTTARTNLNAAATLAAVKPIFDDALQRETQHLNRELELYDFLNKMVKRLEMLTR